MKHLKRFNEGFEPNEVEDLKDFCNNTLAYLLDDGFEVKFSKLEVEKDEYLNITLYGPIDTTYIKSRGLASYLYITGEGDRRLFSWSEIKDYYIPFIMLLKNRHYIPYNKIAFVVEVDSKIHQRVFMVDEIVDDNKVIQTDIFSISLKVKLNKI
jgi:hypothetical protein